MEEAPGQRSFGFGFLKCSSVSRTRESTRGTFLCVLAADPPLHYPQPGRIPKDQTLKAGGGHRAPHKNLPSLLAFWA